MDKQNFQTSKQQFSELITDIVDREGPLIAADILQDCFEILIFLTVDPFLLQQAARVYYLKIFNFEEALNIAEKAISFNKTNSYLLDTKGQVFKEQLKHDFPTNQKYWSVKDGGRIIELAFKALDVFHESLRAAKMEYKAAPPTGKRRQRLNDSGFYGSFYVACDLVERLLQVEEFTNETLRMYLLDPNFIPSNVRIQWNDYHSRVKQLQPAVNWLMDELADQMLNVNRFEEMQTTIDMRNKSYNDMKIKYQKYFGTLPTDIAGKFDVPHQILDACEERRRKIRATAVTVCSKTGKQILDNRSSARVLGFGNVFDLFQWFWIFYGKKDEVIYFAIKHLTEAKKELNLNTPKSKYDLQMLIYLNLLLANFEVKGTDTLDFYKETFDYCMEYFDKSKEDENLYPTSLIVMLMWPRENMPCEYNNSLFMEALERLKAISRSADAIKDTVQFYLGKGKGLQAFIHAKKLSHGSKYRLDRDRFWTEKSVQEKVCRVGGYSNQVTKILANNVCNRREPVLVLCKKPLERFSQEEGTFVLGFKKTGPIAFDWQEAKKTSPKPKPSETTKRSYTSKAPVQRNLRKITI